MERTHMVHPFSLGAFTVCLMGMRGLNGRQAKSTTLNIKQVDCKKCLEKVRLRPSLIGGTSEPQMDNAK